jgi:Tfp pilus assembly protein PilV
MTSAPRAIPPRSGWSHRFRRGFTVLEVSMGAMVMFLAVSTSILVLQRGYQSLDDARNTTLATQVLQSLMEDLRLNNWTQINALQSAANNGVSGNVTIDSSFTGYSTTAANMLSDFVCTRTVADVSGQSNMKLLTLAVTWVGYNGTSHSLSFSSYYGKSGLYDYFYTTH